MCDKNEKTLDGIAEEFFSASGEKSKTMEALTVRPLVLMVQGTVNPKHVDQSGHEWVHQDSHKHTCDICGHGINLHGPMWSLFLEGGNFVRHVCSECVLVISSVEWKQILRKAGISHYCLDFTTCSQNAEVTHDYHMRSGDMLYRDYRCVICGREWFATYRPEQEIDTHSDEVLIDNT